MTSKDGIDKPIDEFVEAHIKLAEKARPEILYHYTSNSSLLGIVEKKKIWFTHALFTNDASEFSHGMDLFIDAISRLESEGVKKDWCDLIKKFIKQEKQNPFLLPFVFSMSEKSDQLSQWRGYGDSGFGISIGFNSAAFKPVHVIYDDSQKQEIISAILKNFVQLIKSSGKSLNDQNYVRMLALAYFRLAYLWSIRFKNAVWEEEKEWRSIFVCERSNSDVSLRVREKTSIIYSNSDPPEPLEKSIREIVIGPRANRELEKIALETLLDKKFSFKICESAIPHR